MTGQINDGVRYRNEDYSLIAEDGEGLFHPADHGIAVRPISTACWRGYVAQYAVVDGGLVLASVELGLEDPDAEVFGVRPRRERYSGPHYDGLAIPVPFTGGLLIGRDFIRDLYVHMGFQSAWKYREVHELVFDSGFVTAARDLSAEMAAKREAHASAPEDRSDVEGWIRRSFSRRYPD